MDSIATANTKTKAKHLRTLETQNLDVTATNTQIRSPRSPDPLLIPIDRLTKLYHSLDIAPGGILPEKPSALLDIRDEAEQLTYQLQHVMNFITLKDEFKEASKPDGSSKFICQNPDDILYEEALHQAQNHHRLSDISIHLSAHPVKMKSEHLRIVVREAIDNAFKFSKANTQVELSTVPGTDNLTIEISDHGKGLSEKEMESLNSYEPLSSDGIGLLIMWEILRFYGGEFSVFSIPERGTTVRITLPLEKTS